MRSRAQRPLAIVGATASGKSGLALDLARALVETTVVEIVSIDSMQVYRGMDIGTAAPTASERAEIVHHLIGIVEPTEEFTVAEFANRARAAIASVRDRGAVPLLVGGTGLYLRAVIDDLDIPGRYPDVRRELEAVSDTAVLHSRLARLDPAAAARMEPSNRRRVIRALEVTVGSGRRFSSYGPGLDSYRPVPFVQVGLHWDRDALWARIAARYQRQLEDGFLDEVRGLAGRELSRTAAQALGYRELLAHLRGEVTLEEAVELTTTRTLRFARRQQRWFRRDPRIQWLDAPATVGAVMAAWDGAIEAPVLPDSRRCQNGLLRPVRE